MAFATTPACAQLPRGFVGFAVSETVATAETEATEGMVMATVMEETMEASPQPRQMAVRKQARGIVPVVVAAVVIGKSPRFASQLLV